MTNIVFDNKAVQQALDVMAAQMQAEDVYLVGIQRGGAKVADALQQRLQKQGARVQRGNLDISFYRDDFDTVGPNPEVKPSDLSFDLNDKPLWLVDDVLYTGRTIRAALGEIFDYGRPALVKLAVLLDRGGRELPIVADCAGLNHHVADDYSVELVVEEGTKNMWHIEEVQRQVSA